MTETNRSKILLQEILNSVFIIPEELDLIEWADKYRMLSREASAKPGHWETLKTPYMIEIYKAIMEDDVRIAVIMAAAQMAKSELLLNVIGRFMHLDPCPMLIVQPDVETAESFSKERVAPMIRDTEVLSKLVMDANKKNSGNSITHKMFPGGFMAFVGTNSESKLASKPIRLLLCDEVDRYAVSSGDEGSPLELVKKRTTTFPDSKTLITGTPTIKNHSEIEYEYLNSSQGKYHLACIHCGEYQELLMEDMMWQIENDEAKNVEMVCRGCGVASGEEEWKRENQSTGKWLYKFPDRKVKGFHLNAFASTASKLSWESIITDYLQRKDYPDKLKAFVNTVLAETYEDEGEIKIDYTSLIGRAEKYKADLPEEVLLLTAGIDVQGDWIAIEVLGHGLDNETWGIEYKIIRGNLEEDETWDKLDKYLQKRFEYEDGNGLYIYSACIDTGGNHTQRVYDFVSPRQESRRIFGVKGQGGDNIPVINGFRRTTNKKIDLLAVGVNALKDITFSRLKIEKPGKGYCHFPKGLMRNYDKEYFESLTAEVKITDKRKTIWKKIRKRNEALDCRNYAIVAKEIFEKLNMNELAALTKAQREELSLVGQLITKIVNRKIRKVIDE